MAKVPNRYARLIESIFRRDNLLLSPKPSKDGSPCIGQVEIDEVYIGIDKRGALYVLPVQAKGGSDRIGVVQIEQDFAACAVKFPGLICRSIAAQFMDKRTIALFELEQTDNGIGISADKHYSLVNPDELSAEELESYGKRT